MKTKPTLTILVCVLAAGVAVAQSPISVIENTRTTMNGVRDNSAAASNAALGIQGKAPSAASATQAPSKSGGAPSVSLKTASTKTNTAGTSKAPAEKTSSVKPVRATAGSKSVHAKAVAVAPMTPKN